MSLASLQVAAASYTTSSDLDTIQLITKPYAPGIDKPRWNAHYRGHIVLKCSTPCTPLLIKLLNLSAGFVRILGGSDELLHAYKSYPLQSSLSDNKEAIDNDMDSLVEHLYQSGAVTILPKTQILSKNIRTLVGNQTVHPLSVSRKDVFDRRFSEKLLGQFPGGASILFVEFMALPEVNPHISVLGLSIFNRSSPSQVDLNDDVMRVSMRDEIIGSLLPQIKLPKKLPICASTPGRASKPGASMTVSPFNTDMTKVSTYIALREIFDCGGDMQNVKPEQSHSQTKVESMVESKMITSSHSYQSKVEVKPTVTLSTTSTSFSVKLDPNQVPFCPEHTTIHCLKRLNRKPGSPQQGQAYYICPEVSHTRLPVILGSDHHHWIDITGTFRVWESELISHINQ